MYKVDPVAGPLMFRRLAALLWEEGLLRSAGVRVKGMYKDPNGIWMLKTVAGDEPLNHILAGLGGFPIREDVGTFWVFSFGHDTDAIKEAARAWAAEDPSRDEWDFESSPEGADWRHANADFMAGAFGKYFPSRAAAVKNAKVYRGARLYVGRVRVPMSEIKPFGKTTRQLMFFPKRGQYAKPVPGTPRGVPDMLPVR